MVAVAAFLISFFPVFVAFSGTGSPFLFGCAWQIGLVLGLVVFLSKQYPDLLWSPYVWKRVGGHITSIRMAAWVASQSHTALFAWSASVVEVAITSALYSVSPLATALLTTWLFRSEGRYQRIGPPVILAFLAAAAGVSLVLLSYAGDGGLSKIGAYVASPPAALGVGATVALSGAAIASLDGFGFRWGAAVASDLLCTRGRDAASLEMFSGVAGLVICSLFTAPGLVLFGLARGEPVALTSLWWALIGGIAVASVATVLWRRAILKASSLKILLAVHLRPLLSLAWLYSLSLVGDVDGKLLLGGAVVIVVANLLVWAEGRHRSPGLRES